MALAEVLSVAGGSIEVSDTVRRARELYLSKGNVVSANRAARRLTVSS